MKYSDYILEEIYTFVPYVLIIPRWSFYILDLTKHNKYNNLVLFQNAGIPNSTLEEHFITNYHNHYNKYKLKSNIKLNKKFNQGNRYKYRFIAYVEYLAMLNNQLYFIRIGADYYLKQSSRNLECRFCINRQHNARVLPLTLEIEDQYVEYCGNMKKIGFFA